MPNKSISMNKIRQVLRCYASGSGTKSISSMLNMSRNTVKKYLHIYQKSGFSFEEILLMDDSSLHALFQESQKCSEEPSERYKALQSLLPDYAKRLKKKGVTRHQLFLEYRLTHPDGYARSRFGTYFQAYLALSHPVARLEHKAGDKMFIDYAGDKLSIIDREAGEIIPVEVFVAILPCSQLTFVEAVMTQRKEDLIHACESALLFYGGTPAAIVPDNLKAAVSRPSRYEAELNEDFAAFAEHYGCAVIPARVRKPKDKALVEGAVKLIYRSIYTKLHDQEFYDLASCQRVMTEWNPNKFLQEAASIHPDVENYIRQVIETKNHPEQAYKSCRGILNFASRVGRKRLINACRWASCYGLYNYPAIDKILRNRQDELPMEEYEDSSQERSMPAHENIRGKDYYN